MQLQTIHPQLIVLRDDLLLGGTKSVLLAELLGGDDGDGDDDGAKAHKAEFVYASPVYGGFQIALAAYCQSVGKQATIFCAQRKKKHPNTLACLALGAQVIEVSCGYLTVVEKRARDYCADQPHREKITFGAASPRAIRLLADRMQSVTASLGREPDEIWCAVGSGTLLQGILLGTTTAHIKGVMVGKECTLVHPRVELLRYHQPFDKESKFPAEFPSMPNYDLKAYEYCRQKSVPDPTKTVLFWNVLG